MTELTQQLPMVGPWQREKHSFSASVCHEVFMTDTKHEYKSFTFLCHTCAGEFTVTVDIMSLDTVTFTQWKLSRPLNNIDSSLFSFVKLHTM